MPNKDLVVLWDWNGTLVDDVFVFVDILNVLLKKNNKPLITQSDYRSSFCFPVEKFYKKIGLYKNRDFFACLNVEFIRLYKKKMFLPLLKKNILSVLKLLSSQNISQYVLSAQNQNTLTLLVKHYDVEKYFCSVFGVENDFAEGKVARAKEVVASICSSTTRIVVVGDTKLDLAVADAVGAKKIFVDWGHYNKQRLSSFSSPVCSSVSELRSCLLSLLSSSR